MINQVWKVGDVVLAKDWPESLSAVVQEIRWNDDLGNYVVKLKFPKWDQVAAAVNLDPGITQVNAEDYWWDQDELEAVE
jgi:hypothetical protein